MKRIRLSNIRIRPKLLVLFVQTGLFPLIVVAFLYTHWVEKSLVEESFHKLNSIQEIRKGQIENYFAKSFVDIRLLADSERIFTFLRKMQAYREKNDVSSLDGKFNITSTHYRSLIDPIHKQLQDYALLNGYSDLYLLDADYGHVMFSVRDGDDNGENLRTGRLKNSALADVWSQVLKSKQTVITDFTPYEPAGGDETAFIGHQVTNLSGQMLGVVVLRFNSNLISKITESRRGMGETGESYLIGWDNSADTFEFRSNMTTMGDGHYVVGYDLGYNLQYWLDARGQGNAGGRGIYLDSAAERVLVAFDRLQVQGMEWYLISKIDHYEVTAPVRKVIRNVIVFIAVFVILTAIWAWLLSGGFTRPILRSIAFAEDIAQGDYDAKIESIRKDELGDLERSLNNMAGNLKEVNWLKSGKERLDDAIRGELEPDELARRCIHFLVNHFEAELGALYLMIEGRLHLRASYAFSDRDRNFNTFDIGEGVVGQAALERNTLYFTNLEDQGPKLNYGAGEKALSHYMAIPIYSEQAVAGVVLLGTHNQPTKLQKKFLEQNVANMAILFTAAQSRHRIAILLEEAKVQQEELKSTNDELEGQAKALKESEAELQAQQEELRVTNEELEEQTKALKESKLELQTQQEELRTANEELEKRTILLEEQKNEIWATNSDLKEAQEIVEKKMKELEVASKYKTEFLANMSHELRTPLNSILILSQLLSTNKEKNLTDKQVESADAINSSGSELLKLINEILDLSKVEAGKIDLVIEDVPLKRIKNDLNRMYKDIAEKKGVALDFSIAADISQSIRTDSQRLQQILRNLLTNAFKFTQKGTVTLQIDKPDHKVIKGSALTPENSLAFSVIDQGIGIAEDKQKIIFDAFQQADGSTSRNYGGTGLGLSISKELAKLLGGAIHLHSVPGQGSTFTIVLPLNHDGEDSVVDAGEKEDHELDEPASISASQKDVQPQTEQEVPPSESVGEVVDDRAIVTPTSKSLLIIEDDNNFSKILRDFAREHDFQVIIAEDGEKGLHYADYYKPSAIILDIGLPGIDGWTVMERLKDNPDLRHIPVHFMSAEDNSMNALRMGAIGYLTKPVSMEKIEETFGKLEKMIAKPVRRLLLVEDDTLQRESIKQLIGNSDVTTTAVGTGKEAFEELEKGEYDCMILDLGLEDMSGFELLEKIRKEEDMSNVPIIIYTGRELTEDEEAQLNQYAESIIIKGVKSPERLLDESALFLHRVEANLPEEKRQMIKSVHDKDAILVGSKVLLTDDDMRNVFALTSVLEEKGIEITIARDGLECLEKLEEADHIDAVLMDIMMPKMDGYEAMKHIREKKEYAKLPIIALTAKAMKGDRKKCIDAGASDYLAKPVDPDKLISMLRVWLYK